jgi:hypothetical protein
MYIGEMQRMGLSLSTILGLHPSTIAQLSTTCMYFGEMESMGLSFASILGLHSSTIAQLSNSNSNPI